MNPNFGDCHFSRFLKKSVFPSQGCQSGKRSLMAATELCSAVSKHGHPHHLPKDHLLAFCNSWQSNRCDRIFRASLLSPTSPVDSRLGGRVSCLPPSSDRSELASSAASCMYVVGAVQRYDVKPVLLQDCCTYVWCLPCIVLGIRVLENGACKVKQSSSTTNRGFN